MLRMKLWDKGALSKMERFCSLWSGSRKQTEFPSRTNIFAPKSNHPDAPIAKTSDATSDSLNKRGVRF